ncbi:MAG: hypothetical protein JW741_13570 [Sedimentisphaerales bacterium]|nr:hypothetical protein [Sedimentisphaerales bacterium]
MGQDDSAVCEVPAKFSIEDIPFEQYKRQAEGFFIGGRKAVRVRFFDPAKFPEPESRASMRGGYPQYFVLTIDWIDKRVIHHYAHEL